MTDDNDTAITVCQLDSLRNLFLNGTDITAVIEKERVMSGWDAKISRFPFCHRGGIGPAVNKEKAIFPNDRKSCANGWAMGGCLGTLMVIDAGNAGQAVDGFLHKGRYLSLCLPYPTKRVSELPPETGSMGR